MSKRSPHGVLSSEPFNPELSMTRFIHTSDWHLGLRLRYVDGDRGARARNQRFDSIIEIGKLAEQHQAEAIIVAGDVFDANFVSPDQIHQTRDLLAKMPCDVIVIPGNHDFGCAGGALAQLAEATQSDPHIHVALNAEPITINETRFYPCPLMVRHTNDDPTGHLPTRTDENEVWVAIAHGTINERTRGHEAANLIDHASVVSKGFDYLALGDQHFPQVINERVAFSGTHEPSSMRDKNGGHVLLVDIAKAGAEPTIEQLAVGRIRVIEQDYTVSCSEDIDAIEADLMQVDERSWTQSKLRVSGTLPMTDALRLQAFIEQYRNQLLYLDDEQEVSARPSDEELQNLQAPGFLGAVLEVLLEDDNPHAESALFLFHNNLDWD